MAMLRRVPRLMQPAWFGKGAGVGLLMYSSVFGAPPVSEFLTLVLASPDAAGDGAGTDRPLSTGAGTKNQASASELHRLLRKVEVVGYGVLGEQLDQRMQIVRNAPDPLDLPHRCVVVDPAGLPYIQQMGPAMAGAASGALYSWLGINRDRQFPPPVVAAVTRPGLAKLHVYGPASVIHAVGPNFTDRQMARASQQEGEAALAETYANILKEFLGGVGDGAFCCQTNPRAFRREIHMQWALPRQAQGSAGQIEWERLMRMYRGAGYPAAASDLWRRLRGAVR
jgi:hypothetical protein